MAATSEASFYFFLPIVYAMRSQSIDEYLKALHLLTQKNEFAKTTEIAKTLSVSPSSVTEMLEKMSRQGLVDHSPYHGSKLTAQGQQEAKKMIRRYRLLQVFFQKFLGLSRKEASDQACLMEHHISDKVEENICTMLDRPMESFDNQPVPKCGKRISCEKCLTLASNSSKGR